MEFLDAFANHEISQCKLEIDPLPFEMIQKTRASVTIEAGHFIV